ncbi:MAG: integrase, partial [Nitrosopumilus sp.]
MIVAEPTFTKTRNIENYLDRIQLKSKGTIKNIESYLRRFDSYLQDTYNKPNEVILDEILSIKNNQDVVLFDILQDFVNYLSGKTNRLNANTISSGYVRHTVYAIKGYLRFYGFKITSDDLNDALVAALDRIT